VEGQPFDPATGTLSLAGGGTFVNGRLNGKRCLMLVEGTFVPNPWA
jgi:hypothetical protein